MAHEPVSPAALAEQDARLIQTFEAMESGALRHFAVAGEDSDYEDDDVEEAGAVVNEALRQQVMAARSRLAAFKAGDVSAYRPFAAVGMIKVAPRLKHRADPRLQGRFRPEQPGRGSPEELIEYGAAMPVGPGVAGDPRQGGGGPEPIPDLPLYTLVAFDPDLIDVVDSPVDLSYKVGRNEALALFNYARACTPHKALSGDSAAPGAIALGLTDPSDQMYVPAIRVAFTIPTTAAIGQVTFNIKGAYPNLGPAAPPGLNFFDSGDFIVRPKKAGVECDVIITPWRKITETAVVPALLVVTDSGLFGGPRGIDVSVTAAVAGTSFTATALAPNFNEFEQIARRLS